MPDMDERCADLDVHKKTVVAGVVTPTEQGSRPLSLMTIELWALADGLVAYGGTPVAMASTGDSWKPVFNRREGAYEVLLVHAPHVNAVPGRTTAVTDAAWL